MKSGTKLFIAVSILGLFFSAGAMAQDQDVAAAARAQNVKQAQAQLDPKPTFHADTQTFTCPSGFVVSADENEAAQGKPFVHCVKAAKTALATAKQTTPVVATGTPALPTLANEPTYEEAVAYIRAASAAHIPDSKLPATITERNLPDNAVFAGSKAIVILATGNYGDAESWISVIADQAPADDSGLPAMKVSSALLELETKVIDKQELSEACVTGVYTQLQLHIWWSVPKSCDLPVQSKAPKVETPAPTNAEATANTVVAGYSLGMSFADFISTTTFRNKSSCDANCQKVLRRAESGKETWFQTDKAKLCFAGGKLVEIDADGKTYRIN